ncbi:diamine acetyltransferase 1-like [Amphiura filiformis]|uniref:diamine acetyltransferase 1-like n=1 Tax=Amphiura filiformis TaxID=82378 RepID=UPI003B223513
MASYVIRQARIEDCDVIHQLLQEFAVHEKYDAEKITNTIKGLKRDGFGERAWFHCLVSECVSYDKNMSSLPHNGVVGFLVFYYGYDAWQGKLAYMSDIFVTEKHRGNGLGKKMMQQAARISRGAGCQKMQWIVSEWNVPARNFYKRIGAEDYTDQEKEAHRQHYIVLDGKDFNSFAEAGAKYSSSFASSSDMNKIKDNRCEVQLAEELIMQ